MFIKFFKNIFENIRENIKFYAEENDQEKLDSYCDYESYDQCISYDYDYVHSCYFNYYDDE